MRPRQRLTSKLKTSAGRAPLQIDLAVHAMNQNQLRVTTQLTGTQDAALENASLYLAVTESGLSSTIKAGENAGRKLHHEHVVRALLGPLPAHAQTITVIQKESNWIADQLALVAFVESDKGTPLQAVRLNLGTTECQTPEQ